MHAISVKNLRLKMPFVCREVEKGESFLVILKSKPIGYLIPIDNGEIEEIDEEMRAWEKASAQDLKKHIPPITKEEYDYYMSLPPLNDQ